MLTLEDITSGRVSQALTVPYVWNDPQMMKINTALQEKKGYQPEEFILGNKLVKGDSGEFKKIIHNF